MPDRSATSTEKKVCATCGAAIPPRAPGGQCPRCRARRANPPGIPEPPPDDGVLDDTQVRDFGDYELLEEIARGGMGVVYRAWQRSAERDVAVKMILAGQLATPQAVARFRNEAAAAAKLAHPNIVEVYEIGEFQTQHFYSMRYVPGGRNIAEWTRELPAEHRVQAVALAMAEVARAVAFAHERGVLHRDLKPSNILIDENDEPQVTDFGLAKLLDEGAPALTRTSAIIGSPSYMAPEQAEGLGREATTAADVYGLGAILYELLAGRPPFEGPSPLVVAQRVVSETPGRLRHLPPDIETICLKCLAKTPRQRYATALELAEDLERFARGEPVVAEPESTFSMVAAWSRRHPAVAALLAALGLTLVAGFAVVAWQLRQIQRARTAELRTSARLRATVAHLEWRNLDTLLERDHAPRALLELSAHLRADPWSWQAATYAISMLEQRPFALPAGPAIPIDGEWLALPPALAADSRRAAFVAKDGRVRVLDVARGVDAFPPVKGGEAAALAFSPDGTRLAIGEKSGHVVLCELPSGRILSRTGTLAIPLRALTFSADGRTLALAGGDFVASGSVQDFAAGFPPLRLLAAGFAPGEIRCSADGRTLLAWSVEKGSRLGIWGPPGSAPPLMPETVKGVRDAQLDAAGGRLAFISGPFEVAVWDVAGRSPIHRTADLPASPERLAFTPDGHRVIVGDSRGETRVYSAETGMPASAPMLQHYETTALSLDAAGTRVLAGNVDFTARLWDVRTGAPLCEAAGHEGRVRDAKLSRDGSAGLTLCQVPGKAAGVLRSWHFRAAEKPREFRPEGGRNLNGSRLSPDESLFAVGSSLPRNSVTIFETATGRPLLDRFPIEGAVQGCDFTPDGRRLIVTTNAGWIYGWHVPAPDADRTLWRPLWPPVRTPAQVQPSSLSPDGTLAALGGMDGTLRLYETASGTFVREMRHGSLIKGVRFSPDGKRVATAGTDGLAEIWDVATGARRVTLRGHRAEVLCAQFSPDGTRIVTASYDSTARVWDAATGEPLTPPLQHRGEVSLARFNRDGRIVGTASRDGTARLWDAATGRPIFEPISRPTAVQQVDFLPDGRRFFTFDLAELRLWDLITGEPITVPYPISCNRGLGLDGPSFQDFVSPRGGHLAISNALDAAVYWPVPDPPAPVPAWFPDFLDDLATSGLGPAGEAGTVPSDRLGPWRARAAGFRESGGYYERWLRRYLGLGSEAPGR